MSLNALVLSWDACINGGRIKSHVIHSSWFCPLIGLLKMIFDGSFNSETGRGSLGEVIRDGSGQIIKLFLGAIDCSNANGAEVHAMLVGCRELLQ